MVSYHGTPHAGGFIPLTRMLGIETIPTVSYLIPMRQSGLDNRRDQISDAAASTLNAEIALYGQKQLQEGGIISYFSDTDDSRGRTYKVSMAGRAYQMKAGLAEMALNTGAAIVPFTRYCLPDGRIQTEFFSPLQPVGRERQDQVEKVIFSYGEFIEQNWRTHPEAVSWSKIKRHLQFPLSDERQSD